MDIVIGSGNNRQKITFVSGYTQVQRSKNDPIEYIKDCGMLMNLIRTQVSRVKKSKSSDPR